MRTRRAAGRLHRLGRHRRATFRDLLTEWKAAGRAAKDVDDALWKRFKAAQDTFFKARNAVNAERDAEFGANAAAKEALLAEAEAIDVPTRTPHARRCGRSATSGTPSARCRANEAPEFERRMSAVEKKVRDAASDPEASTRRPRPGPTSSGSAPSNSSRQAAKAEAAGRTKDAEQARANAAQWREWAEAAVQALGKKR